MAGQIRTKTKYPNIYFNQDTQKYDVKYNFKIYDVKTQKNKYKSKWTYNLNTIKEARTTLAEMQSKGITSDDKDITIKGAFDLWILKADAQDYSVVSKRNTEQQYNMMTKFLPEYTKIKDIDEDLYYTFMTAMRDKGYSAETLHSINACFRKLINLCYKKRLIYENPLHRVDNVRTTTKLSKIDKYRVLTDHEWEMIDLYFRDTSFVRLGVDRYKRFRLLYNVLYYSGIRIGEALALTFSDFEEIEDGMRIKITKSYVSEYKLTKIPKNIKNRYIPIPDRLIDLYNNELENYAGNMREKIFNFDYSTALSIITRCCKKIDIPHISPHGFRHTYISNLISYGVPLPLVEQVSGDTQETIIKTYSHLINMDERIILKVFQ